MTALRPEPDRSNEPTGPDHAVGDVIATWVLWALLLVAMAATYARLEVADLYNVSRDGVAGAGSRVLVQLNYPVALVAIAIVLIAMDRLDRRWWWLGAPAIMAGALTAWPGVVDDGDLDARVINVVPALGVAAAVVLTAVAARRGGVGIAPRRRHDRARIVVAAVVFVISLPWLAADLGWFLPEFGFISQRPITGSDGVVDPAVHLGHHHGFDGALILLSALLLSRPRLHSRTLRAVTTGYVSLMAVYGSVNATQDFWHEQIQKRDWIDWTFPKATEPSLTLIWLFILAGAAAVFVLLTQESQTRPRRAAHPAGQ